MMQQKFSRLTMDDIDRLVPGDVVMFYSTEAKEVYGVVRKVWKAKMMILQSKERNFLFFDATDRVSVECAKNDFFLGKYFTKLDDNQHPPVVKEGFSYVFAEE